MTTFTSLLQNLQAAYESDNYRQIQKALKAARDIECSFENGHYEIWALMSGIKLNSKKTVLKALAKQMLQAEFKRNEAKRTRRSTTSSTATWVEFYYELCQSYYAERRYLMLARQCHPDAYQELNKAWTYYKTMKR